MKLADHAQSKSLRHTHAPTGDIAVNTDELDAMLGRLEIEHTNLLELAKAHKNALTHASPEELNTITLQTSDVLMRIAEIEDARRQLVTSPAGELQTLDQLMDRFTTHDRDRIGQRQTRLRELIAKVKDEQEAVRQASDNLASHMRGLIKQVSASLSHAGTYSRIGAVDPSRSQVVSSLDVTQ